jgi:GT2 family glycosyltransferase
LPFNQLFLLAFTPMNEKLPKPLSIIIPNYNGEQLLPQFMPSLFRALENHSGVYEIIIVDDCSRDNSAAVIQELVASYSRVRAFFNAENVGFSGTCNVGIREARYEILFFFNNDVEICADYFTYYSSYFDQPDTFAVTTCGYYYDSRLPLDGIKTVDWARGMLRMNRNIFNEQINRSRVPPPYRSICVQGAYFFADAAKVRQLHGFDELLNPYIWEESDLSYRAVKRGWTIYYEPRCVGYHRQNTSINKVSTPFTKLKIGQRNRIIVIWKNIHYRPYLLSHAFFMLLKVITLNRVYIAGSVPAVAADSGKTKN